MIKGLFRKIINGGRKIVNRIETTAMVITVMLFFAVITGTSYEFFHPETVMVASSSLWVFLFIKRKCDGVLCADDSFGVALSTALYNAAFIAYFFNIHSIDEDMRLDFLYPPLLMFAIFITGWIIRDLSVERYQSLSLLLKKEIDNTLYLKYHVRVFFIYYSVLWCLLCYNSIIKNPAVYVFFFHILLYIFSSLVTFKVAVFICILSAFLSFVSSDTPLGSIMCFLSSVSFLKAAYCMVKRGRV